MRASERQHRRHSHVHGLTLFTVILALSGLFAYQRASSAPLPLGVEARVSKFEVISTTAPHAKGEALIQLAAERHDIARAAKEAKAKTDAAQSMMRAHYSNLLEERKPIEAPTTERDALGSHPPQWDTTSVRSERKATARSEGIGCEHGLAAVVTATGKDAWTLTRCIRGLVKHARDVNMIFVVSPLAERHAVTVRDTIALRDAIEAARASIKPQDRDRIKLIDETIFPFNFSTVHDMVTAMRIQYVDSFRPDDPQKPGPNQRPFNPAWYLQQLLKLSAPYVLENVTDFVAVDSDVVFMRDVRFGAAPRRANVEECFSAYHYSFSMEIHRRYKCVSVCKISTCNARSLLIVRRRSGTGQRTD